MLFANLVPKQKELYLDHCQASVFLLSLSVCPSSYNKVQFNNSIKLSPLDNKANWSYLEILIHIFMILLLKSWSAIQDILTKPQCNAEKMAANVCQEMKYFDNLLLKASNYNIVYL